MRRTIAVALALLLTAARTSAQSSDVATSEAQLRFQEGLLLHDAGHEEEAYAKFVQAYAMIHSPSVLFNLARIEQLTGRLIDACAHFRDYIELPPDAPKVSSSLRQKAHEFLAEIQARVGQLRITATDGANIVVDGHSLAERAPLARPIDVMPGSHAVEAQLGTRSSRVALNIHAGETLALTLEVSVPSAPTEPAVSPSEHARSPAALSTARPVVASVRPRAEEAAQPTAVGWSSTRSWLAPTLGAMAVGAIGAGIGLQLSAQSEARHASDLSAQLPPGNSVCVQTSNPTCQPLYDANHSGQDKRNLALPLFVAGATLAAATVVVLAWPIGKTNERAAFDVSASPASAALYLRGGF